ncbi:MAG: hypothetical protein SFU56_09225 [Capsulimonadales bacterium]|nr:hypothetical protein [Capsulimonadales bacterium]
MALTIEVQRAIGGIGIASFSTIAVLSDSGGADVFDDTDLTPGLLYVYRVRRRDDSQSGPCEYSDWSNLVFLRAPWTEVITMPELADQPTTGAASALYLAIENAPKIPAKAQWKVPLLSGGFGDDMMRVPSNELRNSRTRRRGQVYGRTVYEGTFDIVIKPEGAYLRILRSLFPRATTANTITITGNTTNTNTTVAAVSSTVGLAVGQPISGAGIAAGTTIASIGSGSITLSAAATATASGVTLTVTQSYTHRFSNLLGSRKTMTIIQQYEDLYKVYTGVDVTSLEISASDEDDNPVIGRVGMRALAMFIFRIAEVASAAALLGCDTASETTLDHYSCQMALATVGSASGEFRSMTHTFTHQLRFVKGLSGKRGYARQFQGKIDTAGSGTINFDDDDISRIWRNMGVASVPTGGFAPGTTITYQPVSTVFTPPNNAIGWAPSMGIYYENADVITTMTIQDENEIPENLTFIPIDAPGSTSGTDAYIEVKNFESGAAIDAPGLTIDNVPASADTEWIYGLVKSSPSPTTTVFQTTSTHLSNVNDAYNGKKLRFYGNVTAALAGVTSSAISDYDGSNREFTLTSALANAPASGDLFEIVSA